MSEQPHTESPLTGPGHGRVSDELPPDDDSTFWEDEGGATEAGPATHAPAT